MSVKAVTLNHLAKRKDLQKILTTADLHTGNLQRGVEPPRTTVYGEPTTEDAEEATCLPEQVHSHTHKVEHFTRSATHIISHIDSTQKTNISLAIKLEELYGKLQMEQELTKKAMAEAD
jgi:hypothetical protein